MDMGQWEKLVIECIAPHLCKLSFMFLYKLNMGVDFCLLVMGKIKTGKYKMTKQVKTGSK